MRNPLNYLGQCLLIALAILVAYCTPARAGDFGVSDPARWSLSASSGWLAFQHYGGGTSWQGVDIAPAVTFSIHERLALAGNFAHGIPFASEDGHRSIARVQGQLRLYPPPGTVSQSSLFASAGPSWMGELSLREWSGLNTQLAAVHSLTGNLSAFAMYSHGFGWQPEDGDRDFFRVGLNAGTALGR